MTGQVNRMWALEPAFTRVSGSIVGLPEPDEIHSPMPVFLIEHSKGLVLFDTGLNPAAADDPVNIYGELAAFINLDFPRRILLPSQLSDLGYTVDDIGYVIASHLHFDHAGALKEFPHARTYIGEGELAYAYAPDEQCSGAFFREDFDPSHGITWVDIPTGYDHDLFGDGSITILSMPGHSPGSLAASIRLPTRNVILTGDVVHTRYAYDKVVPFSIDSNSADAVRSIKRMKLIEESTSAEVWVNHDADDWLRFGGAGEKT